MENLQKILEDEKIKLQDILNAPGSSDYYEKLAGLACRVGASTIDIMKGHGKASVPQIVSNIHQAFQTNATIAALQINRKYLIVSILMALIALASMIASWLAVFCK